MAVEGGGGNGIDLEKELSCSICTDVLYQPLTLLDCLHTFCGSCLKEWFSWQATSASQSRRTAHPYTCPSCRAEVRGTRPNATVTTLLDMFLQANPRKGKSEVEKEEMRKHYKPGDNVVPPVAITQGSDDSEDERLMDEVRALSMAGVDPAVDANRRTQRNARGSERRRQEQAASGHRADDLGRREQPSRWAAQQAQNANTRLRQQDGEEHQVEHQPSLRSLLSASDADSQEVQEDIMQSIMSSGILEGIDIDHLTPQQEEELTERIAEAYRRRQRQRSRHRERRAATESSSRPATAGVDDTVHSRARGNSATRHAHSRPRPPISRPHLFENSLQEPTRSHRRSTSATSQQSNRSTGPTENTPPAARSATDLSGTSSDDTRRHRRRPSSSNRSVTDPEGARSLAHAHRARATSSSQRDPQPTVHPLEAVRRQDGITNNSSPSLVTPHPVESPTSEHAIRPATSTAAFAPEAVSSSTLTGSEAAVEPSINCDRCGRPSIQYDLHYNCTKCNDGTFNLCLACYRSARGCNYWFGFGYAAWARWHRAAPPEGYAPNHERPHVLSARRYMRPSDATPPTEPNARLQEGAFCERCLNFAKSSYWHCNTCLEGAWGYCSSCLNRGHHCTHPLLHLAHISTLHQTHSNQDPANTSFVPLPHLKADSYALLPIRQDCDICRYPIAPTNTRFHCNVCNEGDYDVCNECYYSLVASGKISQANGPQGWRRCLHGHRMAVVGFQDVPESGGQQRVVVREPVGGWALKEDEAQAASHTQQSVQGLLPPDGGVGMRCLALWNRFVPDQDELSFPRCAEVREVERINEDWFWGVYAGDKGLFPGNHVRGL